jgi:hypothetical protein
MPDDLDAALEDAIDAVEEADSADMRLDLHLEQALLGEVGVSADGRFDREGRVAMVGSVDGFGEQVEVEVRSDGESAWARSDDPAVQEALPDGAEWVEAPAGTLSEQGFGSDFASTFAFVPAVRGLVDAEDVGTDEVGGDEVRLIEGDLDWQAALDAATDDERDALDESLSLGDGEVDLVATVGLDGDGRLRLLQIEGEGSAAGAGDMGELSVSIGLEVRDYDVEVDVEAPPEDEVVSLDDVPEVADSLFGGLGGSEGSGGSGGSGDDSVDPDDPGSGGSDDLFGDDLGSGSGGSDDTDDGGSGSGDTGSGSDDDDGGSGSDDTSDTSGSGIDDGGSDGFFGE